MDSSVVGGRPFRGKRRRETKLGGKLEANEAGRTKVGKLLAFFNRLERLFGRNYQAVLKEKVFKEKEVKGN